jgi:hypothetical protein
MAAVKVDLVIDQGEDWASQMIYTDEYDEPYNIIHPCRLDIKNGSGAVQISLSSSDTAPVEGTIPEIAISTEIGLLQFYLEDTATAALNPGQYIYDLFITLNDNNVYAGNQIQRPIQGNVMVNKRVTVL